MLRSDFVFGQIMHLIAGIGRPRIGVKELRQVMIPIPPKEVQKRMSADYMSRRADADQLKAEARAILGQSDTVLADSVKLLATEFIGGTASMEPTELRENLTGAREPLETLAWLRDTFLPVMLKNLNATDVRRRFGIYAGEKIPENERNLTDVRNRVSLVVEY